MKIVTGYAGEMHITSNDDQGLNQGVIGTGNYILPVGNQFAANLVSANELQIEDGEGVLQGVHFRVEPETTDSVTIDNGSQGMMRIDLVCAQYSKDAQTGVESMEWVVIKGTEAASDPVEPSYTAGDVLGGDTLAQFPVYAVALDGITVDSVELVATVAGSLTDLRGEIGTVADLLGGISWNNTPNSSITPSSTQDLAQLGAVDSYGYYLVILCHPGLSNEDTASVYFIRYSGTGFSGRTVIHEGTEARALLMSTTGVVTQRSNATAYNARIITAKLQ